MTKTRVLVEMDVKPDMAAQFVEMFQSEFVSRSQKEAGCEFYELWVDSMKPNKMTIVEVWTTPEDLAAHLAQDWFVRLTPEMEAAQATPFLVRTFTSSEDR